MIAHTSFNMSAANIPLELIDITNSRADCSDGILKFEIVNQPLLVE